MIDQGQANLFSIILAQKIPFCYFNPRVIAPISININLFML